MAVDVSLPALGEGISRGTLIRWLKKLGDRVEADEPLFEVSTDKIDTEVVAPTSGILIEIVRHTGDEIRVGARVARIGSADEWRELRAPGGGPAHSVGHQSLLGSTLHQTPPMFLDDLDPIAETPASATARVALIAESARDEALVEAAIAELDRVGVDTERHRLHLRDPARIRGFAALAPEQSLRFVIVCGGAGAHLAAVVAAETRLPVIAVPRLDPDGGLAGLLAAAHIPGGLAVVTVAPGPIGARQAAVFAARVLAALDPRLARRLADDLRGEGGGFSGELF